MVPDPLWVAPEPSGDPDAAPSEAPLIEVDNLLCKMPLDAVPITDEQWQALLEQQESGKVITATSAGIPEAQTPPPHLPTLEEVQATRNELLNATAWTQAADERAIMGSAQAAVWDAYRQAVRDVSQKFQPGAEVIWPTKP